MQKNVDVLTVKDSRKFEVECRARSAGKLCVGAESVSVKVGQRVRRDGTEEIWHSVGVYTKEEEDGPSFFRFLSSTPIGKKRCKLPASDRGRVMHVVKLLSDATWTT